MPIISIAAYLFRSSTPHSTLRMLLGTVEIVSFRQCLLDGALVWETCETWARWKLDTIEKKAFYFIWWWCDAWWYIPLRRNLVCYSKWTPPRISSLCVSGCVCIPWTREDDIFFSFARLGKLIWVHRMMEQKEMIIIEEANSTHQNEREKINSA